MTLLSHYTSEAGLIGVVRSQTLWATDFLSLNDATEFVFALRRLYDEALKQCYARIPAELRDPSKGENFVVALPDQIIGELKAQIEAADGYGSLYVCSFARGRDADEDDRGILTLWDRYTRNAGFCLQFEESRIHRLLELEAIRTSYACLELTEVRYGVDQKASDFLHLAEQLFLRLMKFVFQDRRDARLEPDWHRIVPDTVFARDLLRYCATHKDPAFTDEREIRIFAYPVDVVDSKPFSGLSLPKTIWRRRNKPTGARYVALGESILPGYVPQRILAAPKAEMPIDQLRALYPIQPAFARSTIPLA